MNKRLFYVGVVTIGLLLLGSLSTPVFAQEPEGPDVGDFEGVIDLISDISLTNNWLVGPTTGPVSDLTNTNLRYNVTSAVSPLDQFFNAGFFMGGDGSDGPQPEFAIDGTFEGSELFVKIVNDQQSIYDPTSRLLDWQAVLTLGEDITLSIAYPTELADQGVPVDLLPTSVVMPAGSGTPPLPVISTPTNFSAFEDLSEIASWYGYDGLPFVGPAIFFVEDVNDAYSYWNNEVDLNELFHIDDDSSENITVTATPVLSTDFELTLNIQFSNETAIHGDITIMGVWNQASGFLEHFEIQAIGDMDDDGVIEATEEFSFVFDLLGTSQASSPISVGDVGEYLINIDLDIVIDLVNNTEEDNVNSILPDIIQSVEELDGQPLLNFTVDAMDGLYYHLDGYMLDFNKYLGDRLGTIFNGGSGAQDPLPLLQDYYHKFDDGMDERGTHDFAINLFDAQMYENVTSFIRRFDGSHWGYWDEYNNWIEEFHPLQAEDNQTLFINDWIRGIMNAQVFEKYDWEMNYDQSKTLEENLATTPAVEVYNGEVDYVDFVEQGWDYNESSGMYDIPVNWTYTDILINDSIGQNFVPGVDYVAFFEIEALPESGFTSYFTKNNFMMMFGGDNGGNDMNAGMGAQVDPEPDQGFRLPIDPQVVIPMPARTPDWDQVGGAVILMEALVDQLADVITNPDFIAALTNMPMEDEGDSLAIHSFGFDLDWINNATYVGVDAYSELDITQVDNDTGNLETVTTNAYIYTEEHYHWALGGAFDTMSSYSAFSIDVAVVDYPTDETTLPPEDTTTTTDVELSPGFETLFALGSLIALPIFLRKRR
ncbi:MAG: hypothetical protein ACW97Z_13180 [Candidatus Hodarchaeales archaeon]|jgi:hypothetical protein